MRVFRYLAILFMLVSGLVASIDARDQNSKLNKSYQVTLGEMLALELTDFMTNLMRGSEYPIFVFFNKQNSKLEVQIYGTNTSIKTIDIAKDGIDTMRQKVLGIILREIKNRHDVILTESDFNFKVLIDGKPFLGFIDGQYILAD